MACVFEYKGKRYSQDELAKELEKMQPSEAHQFIPGVENIPNAPFKRNWDELALKKIITEAAKNGYDAVSWTPSAHQSTNPSKFVKLLSVSKHGDKYLTYIEGKDGQALFRNTNGFSEHGQKVLTGDELKELVGDSIANKAIEGANNKKNNDWFDIREAGMVGGTKEFYDKILVDKANKLVKQYGGKVEEVPIKIDNAVHYGADRNQKIFTIKLTPELKAKAKEGFNLFSAPVITPVPHNPFQEDSKPVPTPKGNPQPNTKDARQLKITPISFNPFRSKNDL